MVRESRERVNEEWTLSIAENFKENQKKNGMEGSVYRLGIQRER